jgi:hypothetical protein
MVAVGMAIALAVLAIGWVDEGEVATLAITDAQARVFEKKLWIVDLEGAVYVRSGAADDHWLERLEGRPQARLDRNGGSVSVRGTAVADPAVWDAVNRAMSRKYGRFDRVLRWLHGPAGFVPVRLDPVTATR